MFLKPHLVSYAINATPDACVWHTGNRLGMAGQEVVRNGGSDWQRLGRPNTGGEGGRW